MTKSPSNNPRFVFFGTGSIAVSVLEELARAGYLPALVVTGPDAPQGRGLQIAPSRVALWAETRGIQTLKPTRIDDSLVESLRSDAYPLYVVADYGLILPKKLIEIPARGTINMHPSLLPRLRGPSPIRSAILEGEQPVGVSIMEIDEEMDHGPLIAQKKIDVPEWPMRAHELEELLAREGGRLLADVLPHWIAGEIDAKTQNHDIATYTKKFTKADGLLDLNADPEANLRKIYALEGWPGTFAFFERSGKRIRVQILDAYVANGALQITRVKPEGKNETAYEEFARSGARPL